MLDEFSLDDAEAVALTRAPRIRETGGIGSVTKRRLLHRLTESTMSRGQASPHMCVRWIYPCASHGRN